MARRKRGNAEAEEPDARSGAPGTAPPPTQAFARTAILTSLLILAVYTAFGVARIVQEPQVQTSATLALPYRAEALAAHLDAEGNGLRSAALAARDLLQATPGNEQAAAQGGLSVASGSAASVLIADENTSLTSAGKPDPGNWQALLPQVDAAQREVWLGIVPGRQAAMIAIAPAITPKGRRWVIALADPTRLGVWLAKDQAELIVSAKGQVLAGSAIGGVGQTDNLLTAFSLAPEDLKLDGGAIKGVTPDGGPVDLAARPALGGALYALTASPTAPIEHEAQVQQLSWLLIPLAAALLLGLLLVSQSRRVERAQAAFVDSEQRFRLAVEAARCGIWEWDLAKDQMFMSDVTGAIFGWGGGGIVEGQQVLDRVSPDYRDRVRQALATAAVYGGFDVSFRVPSLQGGRPTWIDARGQAFGEKGAEGYSRIIGVALDVTE